MTMMNTEQRVDALQRYSNDLYPIIDHEVDNEQRAKRILRIGMQLIAQHLESGVDTAGKQLIRCLNQGISGDTDSLSLPIHTWDQKLDHLTIRYGNVERGTIAADETKETDASHVIHLTALALPYATTYYPHLNQSRIALYAWVHDIVEAYAGDVPSLGMSVEQETKKHRAEAAALQRITQEFSSTYPQLIEMIHTYETLNDDEAKFVKTFDKLDPGFLHCSNRGLSYWKYFAIHTPEALTQAHDRTTERMRLYAQAFPLVLEDRHTLRQQIIEIAEWNSPLNTQGYSAK